MWIEEGALRAGDSLIEKDRDSAPETRRGAMRPEGFDLQIF
jgi:hypothetical protein